VALKLGRFYERDEDIHQQMMVHHADDIVRYNLHLVLQYYCDSGNGAIFIDLRLLAFITNAIRFIQHTSISC
jgi:hypothetical protein